MMISSYVTKRKNPSSTMVVMKILSNEYRYAIMELLLMAKKDLCVHELAAHIGLSQSATSHQLAHLEACGVVRGVRMGKTKCYMPTGTQLTKQITAVINSLT